MRWERGQDPVGPTWTTLDNRIVDDDLSCRALGLLTRWLRRPPGAELDSITDMIKRAKQSGKKRLEGRDALYAASYELETAGYLVRELIQGARGHHEWVVRIYAQPVPPEHRSDPAERKRGTKKPPRPKKPQVTPSTGFQDSENQESGSPDSENPDSGNQASSYKDSHKDSSLSGDSGVTAEEREKGAVDEPQQDASPRLPEQRSSDAGEAAGESVPPADVEAVVAAYVDAMAPSHPLPRTVARIRATAAELLALQWPVDHLTRLAAELPAKGYSDLARHAEYNPPPASRTARRPAAQPDACPTHPMWSADDCPDCRNAAAREGGGPSISARDMLERARAAAAQR